jgi:hypothetical protein
MTSIHPTINQSPLPPTPTPSPGDNRSPAFGELSDSHFFRPAEGSKEDRLAMWGEAPILHKDIYEVFAKVRGGGGRGWGVLCCVVLCCVVSNVAKRKKVRMRGFLFNLSPHLTSLMTSHCVTVHRGQHPHPAPPPRLATYNHNVTHHLPSHCITITLHNHHSTSRAASPSYPGARPRCTQRRAPSAPSWAG